MEKKPFDVEIVLERVRQAVQPFPPAALFGLADEGFASVWEQLVACIISIRTRDEVTTVAARELFSVARTPADMLALTAQEIDRRIAASTFHERKAAQIRRIAEQTVAEHGGALPCDRDTLLGFHGVGPKCAHLVLGIACGEPRVSVDVHVGRVTHRWGYVHASTPEAAMRELEAKLPLRYHVDINRWLVPFGKHICTGRVPRCSECPVLPWCEQVGVTAHR